MASTGYGTLVGFSLGMKPAVAGFTFIMTFSATSKAIITDFLTLLADTSYVIQPLYPTFDKKL